MSQPSGWYDDPQDPSRLRYWDGILWTDHTVPKQAPTAAASTIGRPVDPYAGSRPADAPVWPGSGGTAPGGPGPTPYAGGPPAYPGQWGGGQTPGQAPYTLPPGNYGYGAAPTVAWRPSGPTTQEGTPLAEWWQRLVGYLIDSTIKGILTVLLGFPWLRDFFTWYFGYLDQLANTPSASTPDFSSLIDEMTTRTLGFVLPLTLISSAVLLVYDGVFLTRWGATPGKAAVGIRVRRVGRAGPLRLVEVLRRVALPIVLGLAGVVPILSYLASPVQLLDHLWLLWDPRRQCLHDKLADTVVEQRPKRMR